MNDSRSTKKEVVTQKKIGKINITTSVSEHGSRTHMSQSTSKTITKSFSTISSTSTSADVVPMIQKMPKSVRSCISRNVSIRSIRSNGNSPESPKRHILNKRFSSTSSQSEEYVETTNKKETQSQSRSTKKSNLSSPSIIGGKIQNQKMRGRRRTKKVMGYGGIPYGCKLRFVKVRNG